MRPQKAGTQNYFGNSQLEFGTSRLAPIRAAALGWVRPAFTSLASAMAAPRAIIRPPQSTQTPLAAATEGFAASFGQDGGSGSASGGFEDSDEYHGTYFTPTNTMKDFHPKNALPYIRETLHFYRHFPAVLRKEVLSGLTVACMQIPESIAFAFVANVSPVQGLFSTALFLFWSGLLGGKPAMVSGLAGALVVVMRHITLPNGELPSHSPESRLEHLMLTMTFCGLFQILAGALQLSKVTKMIPRAGMLGFLNALAYLMFAAQLSAFQFCPETIGPKFLDCTLGQRKWLKLEMTETWCVLVLVALTMATMLLSPKIPYIGNAVPPSLTALLVASTWEHALNRGVFGVPTRTVGDTAEIDGKMPPFHIPDPGVGGHSIEWAVIFQYAATLALIGLVETLMTFEACHDITGTQPTVFHGNQECVAQGFGNLFCSFFKTLGGVGSAGRGCSHPSHANSRMDWSPLAGV